MLQLLADFTGLNMVVSDSVSGNITLRLDDVPWDQALDIILQAKGLDKRRTDNVMWVAPAEEIAERERIRAEAARQQEELAPLRTEFIQINYAKAAQLATLIRGEEGQSLLSERGNVSIDERTNTLIVQDTSANIGEIRQLINHLDIPVRQVLIESRIVIADNSFRRDLGVQFGYGRRGEVGDMGAILGGTQPGDTNYGGTTGFEVPAGSGNEGLIVDLPASADGRSGLTSGLAIGKIGSYLLQLELSAMENEDRGEVISTPKRDHLQPEGGLSSSRARRSPSRNPPPAGRPTSSSRRRCWADRHPADHPGRSCPSGSGGLQGQPRRRDPSWTSHRHPSHRDPGPGGQRRDGRPRRRLRAHQTQRRPPCAVLRLAAGARQPLQEHLAHRREPGAADLRHPEDRRGRRRPAALTPGPAARHRRGGGGGTLPCCGRQRPPSAIRARTTPCAEARLPIFLIGPMGAGKSTVGRRLAARLGLEFIDCDATLEARTGVDIPRIFDIEGEEGFREREGRLLDELTAREGIVLATGGGAVLRDANRRLLGARARSSTCVPTVDTQLRAGSGNSDRPLLRTDDPRARLEALARERNPLYEAIADCEWCDTGSGSMDAVVEAIMEQLERIAP
ncbi:MAG: shikimate kinase [Arhodomonas sp.]|nr:shikimate kinase [Arhodomonas sp.]